MRVPLVRIALVSAALGAIAACAASGAEESESDPPADPVDGGPNVIGDATRDATDATDESFGQPEVCSPAGWCTTKLPDDDLQLTDVFPVGDRAFAIGQTSAMKFLEWDAQGGWTFINKGMEFVRWTSPRTVWAPDENEVFFTITDVSALVGEGPFGAIIVRGVRPAPPATTWSWTRTRIDCPTMESFPHVWGTSRDQVYALTCGKVYRLDRSALGADAGAGGAVDGGDGGGLPGASPWVEDHVDDDAAYPLAVYEAAGTGPDDIWIAGSRGKAPNQCVVLIRKTAAGYATVVDGVPTPGEICVAKPGVAMIKGTLQGGVHAVAKDILVGARPAPSPGIDNDIVKVALVGGEVQVTTASPAATMDVKLSSPWGTSEGDVFLLATRTTAGAGSAIVRATSVWGGSGKFEYSTLAINGAPNTERLNRIRGTSNHNLWVVGSHRAYFKSTP